MSKNTKINILFITAIVLTVSLLSIVVNIYIKQQQKINDQIKERESQQNVENLLKELDIMLEEYEKNGY